jgi:hypothetical protein
MQMATRRLGHTSGALASRVATRFLNDPKRMQNVFKRWTCSLDIFAQKFLKTTLK